MKKDFTEVRLCVLVSGGVSHLSLEGLVREIVAGGADCIQLREKNLSDRELLEHALTCRDACGDALFIVNDRPDIAVLSRADGVHVGQTDVPGDEARRIVGRERIVGISTANLDELSAAESVGADYLGVGAVFPTGTKEVKVRGLEYVRKAAQAATVPFLAIGGVTLENVSEVIEAGAPGVAVFSAVTAADDPRAATRALKERILAALPSR